MNTPPQDERTLVDSLFVYGASLLYPSLIIADLREAYAALKGITASDGGVRSITEFGAEERAVVLEMAPIGRAPCHNNDDNQLLLAGERFSRTARRYEA